MITLVCGLLKEEPIAMLVHSLDRMGAEYVIIDQEQTTDTVQLRWQLTDDGISGHIRINGQMIDVGEIRSVYHRLVNPENMLDENTPDEAVRKTRSVLHALMSLFDLLPAKVVNRRRPMMSNNSKPYQALLIRQAGFFIPDTLITNSPHTLARYASTCGPLIYKSTSSVRSIVAPLGEQSATKMESLRNLATQFQRKIDGFNVRVHVVGREVFATQILTTATDYRYAQQEGVSMRMRPYEMTVDLSRRCVELARHFELDFAGIDLMVSEDGVYCLEVNPCPGYSYYQHATGQPISDALASYLVE
jgi:glutathione synthase/RimK-type ligase-like ATP-grasp enzyme